MCHCKNSYMIHCKCIYIHHIRFCRILSNLIYSCPDKLCNILLNTHIYTPLQIRRHWL